MTFAALIAMLDGLESKVENLAQEVHRNWMRYRQAEGWLLGPPDLARRSSPYLKPLAQFDSRELQREMRLALNDLRGIKDALRHRGEIRGCGDGWDKPAPSSIMRGLGLDRAFVANASIKIHDGWRKVNRELSSSAPDGRLRHPFVLLSAADRRITTANVRADIEAIANLLSRDGA